MGGLDFSRGCHLLLTKEGRNRVWLSQSAPLWPPPPEDGMGEVLEGAGEHPAALSLPAHSLARFLCPGSGLWTRSVYATQAQPLPPRPTLLFPRRAPRPPLVRAEAIHNWVFCPPLVPGVKNFSFSHFLSCLVRWQGSSLAEAFCALPPGPRVILDRVSSTRSRSLAFLTCRAWPCLGSCNTKGIHAHFSQSGAVL